VGEAIVKEDGIGRRGRRNRRRKEEEDAMRAGGWAMKERTVG